MGRLIGDRLGVLVNNSNIYYTMTAIDPDFVMVQAAFNVNIFGPTRMVDEFYPLLVVKAHTYRTCGNSTKSTSKKHTFQSTIRPI